MRIRSAVIAFLLLAPPLVGASAPFALPAPGPITTVKDLQVREGVVWDLYRPPGDTAVPVVMFVNVGGADYRDWEIYRGWAAAVAGSGMAAILYASPQNEGRSSFDAVAADVAQRAAALHLDPKRIVLWGGSSNAPLTLAIAAERERQSIVGAVVCYGYSTDAPIRTDLPVMIVRAGLDSVNLNRQIEAMVQRALAANAPWVALNHPAGLHGFEVRNDDDVTRAVIAQTLRFMQDVSDPVLHRAHIAAAPEADLGAAYARSDWPFVIEGYTKLSRISPLRSDVHWRLGLALAAAGRNAEALTELEKAYELGIHGTIDIVVPAARAAARAGNAERSVYWLKMATATRWGPKLEELRTAEDYASIRETPEFRALLAQLGAK